MIDPVAVKNFWNNRASNLKTLPFESIVNLEENPALLEIKIQDENKKVFEFLNDLDGKTVLDLGAGIGLWSLRFLQKGASFIDAVEYSDELCGIGKNAAANFGYGEKVTFYSMAAENFLSDIKYDIIFISGLFVYLNDDQTHKLMSNVIKMMNPQTIVYLRDGTAIKERYEINNRFSENVNAYYSAVYRTSKEYIELFKQYGLKNIYEDYMFPDGHVLNKYVETRLKVFAFNYDNIDNA